MTSTPCHPPYHPIDRPTDPNGAEKCRAARKDLFNRFLIELKVSSPPWNCIMASQPPDQVAMWLVTPLSVAVKDAYGVSAGVIAKPFHDACVALARTFTPNNALRFIEEHLFTQTGPFPSLFNEITNPMATYIEQSILAWKPLYDEESGLGIRAVDS